MKNSIKNIIIICLIIILSTTCSLGIIVFINRLNKKNLETKFAEEKQIEIAKENIFYVDLTYNPEDYKEVQKREELNKENSKKNIQDSQDKNKEVKKIDLKRINEDYYDVEIDIDSKEAIVDGEKKDISDLLNENIQIEDYLKENAIGDIEIDNNKIKIQNPYSTNSFFVETSKINKIKELGEVDSIVKIADNTYCFNYKNAKDTKDGFNILKDSKQIKNICKDTKVKMLEDNYNVSSLLASKNNYVWGANTTGLTVYSNKLNNEKNLPIIKVGVLDTGVRTTHEVFLDENQESKIDLTDSFNYVDNNTNILDDNGHGTMVAGIISEATSNNVKIVPVKILNSKGEGKLSDTLQAIAAISSKVDLINVSLGISKNNLSEDVLNIAESVLKEVYDKNKVITCASGNDGAENVYYPASSEYTIAVSATDVSNNIASFSNYGDTIDFAAPGVALVLPYYTGDNLYNSSFPSTSYEYQRNSGTSFASPFIAAAVALVKSENQNYNASQVKNMLKKNSEDLGASGKDKYYGYGLLNFYQDMFKPKDTNQNTTNTNTNASNTTSNTTNSNTNTSNNTTNSNSTTIEDTKDLELKGDVNKNNLIDIGDILLLLRHVAQNNDESVLQKHPDWKLTNNLIDIGDVNKNNIIDTGDILKLLRYISAMSNTQVKEKHPDWVEL